jgi:hypothetical protein
MCSLNYRGTESDRIKRNIYALVKNAVYGRSYQIVRDTLQDEENSFIVMIIENIFILLFDLHLKSAVHNCKANLISSLSRVLVEYILRMC